MRDVLKGIAAALLTVAAPTSGQAVFAAAPSSPRAAVDDLLAADRAFSSASGKTDLVSGVSAMFDERVVMPGPAGLVRGKAEAVAALRANAANAGARAEWAPVRGGISADGQHGFTFGYMTIRSEGQAERKAKYLAYWVKGPEGWRVAAYKRGGMTEGQGTPPMEPLVPARLVPVSRDAALLASLGKSLAAAEKSFSDEAQKIGLGPAFKKNGRADAMNMGRGAAFRIGAEAIGNDMGSDPVSPVNWSADDVLVASSGDLGVTWGRIRANGPPPEGRPAAIPFFTIWYRPGVDQPWRYIAE